MTNLNANPIICHVLSLQRQQRLNILKACSLLSPQLPTHKNQNLPNQMIINQKIIYQKAQFLGTPCVYVRLFSFFFGAWHFQGPILQVPGGNWRHLLEKKWKWKKLLCLLLWIWECYAWRSAQRSNNWKLLYRPPWRLLVYSYQQIGLHMSVWHIS